MESIHLNGNDLTIQDVLKIAVYNAQVIIDTSKLEKSVDFIEKSVSGHKIIYGVTTGFGSNADKMINAADTKDLQINLLRSHACGVGKPFSKEVTRAIMTIRLNTLLKGYSGVRISTVEQLGFMLNNGIHPVIPEQGSVGASGDLCPLSHMALPLIGEGEVEYQGELYNTEEFLQSELARKIGFQKIVLGYKEGLALNNGTTVMAALATIAVYKSENLMKIATLSSALIFEGLCARKDAFGYQAIHNVRNHKGQSDVAKWLTLVLEGSSLIGISQNTILTKLIEKSHIPREILQEIEGIISIKNEDEQPQIERLTIDKVNALSEIKLGNLLSFAKKKWKPQDSYSIRCIPQIFGASQSAIEHIKEIVANELNAAVDNPLIFTEDDRVVSGGNFHGQPIALVMDYLKLAISEIGNVTERQINKMVDGNTNDCLPSFLIKGSGLNNGLMIPQYVAASLASENKVLVHPSSADSIPTCENTEDHVSMGTTGARQALQIIENVEYIISIAIMVGYSAVTLRLEQLEEFGVIEGGIDNLSAAMKEFYKTIKDANKPFSTKDFLETDRYLSPEIESIKINLVKFVNVADRYIA